MDLVDNEVTLEPGNVPMPTPPGPDITPPAGDPPQAPPPVEDPDVVVPTPVPTPGEPMIA